jgi:hypothetical protein
MEGRALRALRTGVAELRPPWAVPKVRASRWQIEAASIAEAKAGNRPATEPRTLGKCGRSYCKRGRKVQLLSGTAKSGGRAVAGRGPPIELMRKMRRIFLIGVLCGVMIAAAVTFVFAIPANSDRWRMEIWRRGGGAWTFDKSGQLSWKWMVEPIPDTSSEKRAIVPSSHVKVRNERL